LVESPRRSPAEGRIVDVPDAGWAPVMNEEG
jgi:hypothetical protein